MYTNWESQAVPAVFLKKTSVTFQAVNTKLLDTLNISMAAFGHIFLKCVFSVSFP